MPSADTSPRAHAVQLELYRQAGPSRRAEIASDLSDAIREVARVGVRLRHPAFDDQQVTRELLRIFYGVPKPGHPVTARRLFEKLRDALESVGVPYMVTGSFVSAIHGVPRATHDIDVVIAPTSEQLVALVGKFPPSEYYADVEDALQSFRDHSQFNVIDQNSIWKIDFIFRKDRPFSRREFDRRRTVDILGVPLDAATPEDLLIAKLEWGKIGDSQRQIRDAAGILDIQGTDIDLEYIESWVEALDLHEQWLAARGEAQPR